MHMFVLRIPITPSGLDELKAYLTKALPEIKSSHRVEALGRGLGFKTYAALRAAAQSSEMPMATVSGMRFTSYLAEHSFEVDPAHLYRAAAQVAIKGVLDKMPRLSIYGISSRRPQRNQDNTWETPQQSYSRLVELRQECQGLHAAEGFLLALMLLSRIQPTRTITSGSGSYRLKHIRGELCVHISGRRQTGTSIRAQWHADRRCRARGLQVQDVC
jgi:hypothetical protein